MCSVEKMMVWTMDCDIFNTSAIQIFPNSKPLKNYENGPDFQSGDQTKDR